MRPIRLLLLLSLIALPAFAERRDSYAFAWHGNFTATNGDSAIDNLKRLYGDDFFWFTRGGREYVVRDAATLAQLRELYRPQAELGQEQAALGEKQAALGRKQADLGREQARLGLEQASVALDPIGDSDAARSARQNELSRRQNDLGARQKAFGDRQSELGKQQAALGARQTALSRDVEKKLDGIVDDLVRRGIAREVKP